MTFTAMKEINGRYNNNLCSDQRIGKNKSDFDVGAEHSFAVTQKRKITNKQRRKRIGAKTKLSRTGLFSV